MSLTEEQKKKRLTRCRSAAIEYVNNKRLTLKGISVEYCLPMYFFYQYLIDNGIDRHIRGICKVYDSPETIYARYLKLGSMRAAGKYYGISAQAVSLIFQKAKLPRIRRKKIDMDWLDVLRKKGLNNREIAERMGCGRNRIGEVIRNLRTE